MTPVKSQVSCDFAFSRATTPAPTRRDWFRSASWTGLGAIGVGAGLSHHFAHAALSYTQAALNPTALHPLGSAKQAILIWLDGGPTHLELWDPKPEAPSEVRGPFGEIATNVAGIRISEHLPQLAQQMQHWALLRSVTSPLGEHNFGTHYLMSGYRPTPALEYPAVGSLVAHRRPAGLLPGHVAVPHFRVGGSNFSGRGFLPMAAAPFSVGGDPAKEDFTVEDLTVGDRETLERIERRRRYLETLGVVDPALDQAFRLILTPEARNAFDLSQEAAAVRQRYGPRTIGQSCLLARRLIERDVPFVTVNDPGWDTHDQAVTRLRDGYTGAQIPVGKIPSLDLALSALINDLAESGRLETTLVMVMGEFGRTPKLNAAGGRDHWPRCFSVAMAGGGVRGGQVIGASDRRGESPAERPITPADLAASVLTLLGLDPSDTNTTPDSRPIQQNQSGQWIHELT